MNNQLVKGTLILAFATLVSKILGSIFRIPLQNIAGDEVVGIFSLVYPVYMVALTLSVAGIPVAISRLISEANAREDNEMVFNIYKTAAVLSLSFGSASFVLIVLFSKQISGLLGGESVQLALITVSSTLLIAPYMAVYRGFFQGFGNMKPTAISQMLEQLVRVAFILLAAFFLVRNAYSPEEISGGIMVSSLLGAGVSFVYLRYLFFFSPYKPNKHMLRFNDILQTSKSILRISLPICIGAITMALINFVDSFTIPVSLTHSGINEQEIPYLYGIYSRGLTVVQIATVFSSSIILPLIPLISKSIVKHEWFKVSQLTEKTHYYAHLISWPTAIGMCALTLPINLALFEDLQGSAILAVFHLSALFMSLAILGTGILQGMNKETLAAKIILVTVLLKIVLNYSLTNWLGLTGAAYSTLIVYMVIFLLNTYFIWKVNSFILWKKQTSSVVFSSLVMGAAVGVPTLFMNFAIWSRITILVYLLLSIMIAVIIYGSTLFLTRGISKEELWEMPLISKIIRKK